MHEDVKDKLIAKLAQKGIGLEFGLEASVQLTVDGETYEIFATIYDTMSVKLTVADPMDE
jgi:hypothetical protein